MSQTNISLENVIAALEACSFIRNPDCSKCYLDGPGFGFACRDQLRRNALALLKMQESVKPVLDVDTWTCGNCGYTLEHQELLGDNVLFHEQYNYCPECGRKVKWDA